MQTPKKNNSGSPFEIPKEGSLGLLALGYRGLTSWRAVRGTEWLEEEHQRHENAVKETESPKTSREKKQAVPATNVPTDEQLYPQALAQLSITIVSGLPRSGTSMMMQMLTEGGMVAFSDGRREADDSNPRGYFEHEKVKGLAEDTSWLPEAHGLVVKVVAPLLRYLPKGPAYRVIFMERSLDEILSSQAAMLERNERTTADREVLRRVYERQLNEAKAWIRDNDNATLLEVEHRDALSNAPVIAASINAFLGNVLAESKMVGIVDPSLHRVRT